MSDLGEKTEEPTGRKLAQARSKGQVPKSQDLTGVLSLIIAFATLFVFGAFIAGRMHNMLKQSLDAESYGFIASTESLFALVRSTAIDAGAILAPVMIVMFFGIALAMVGQTGLLFTTKPITPDIKRLNPISGLKRIFGVRGIMKTVMNLAKLSIVVFAATIVIIRNESKLVMLTVLGPTQAAKVIVLIALEVLAWVLFLLLVIGVVDFMYQKWQHRKDLRMTKQEVKDEFKSMEGDPETKRRRMKIAQDVALQRVQQDVPSADVIVTNPTHFSVALRYSDIDAAPRVVAKGADHLALRIRQIAAANRVPMVERPPLARALFWGTEVGDLIAPEHYEAVAEILAYVYELDGTAATQRKLREEALV
ncbi:MAG: flagellar biosynthesis protein FlhB [Planctomycetota bacterium]